MSLHLLNTKLLEGNNINIMISLYMNQNRDGLTNFSYYSDYLGYCVGEEIQQLIDEGCVHRQARHILSNHFDITKPARLSHQECAEMIPMFISNMDSLTFEDGLKILQYDEKRES